MNFISSKLIAVILIFFIGCTAFSQALTTTQIDSLVEKAMKTFNVPGMAVAVLKNGEIVSKKGYGVQSVKTKKPVDTKTLFGVASNTKAFTTAALAQLIDAGKLEWDTPVADIIPEFKLYDAYVTREFTVRDLLTHRSGLGLGAGDLMVIPATNTTTLDEMIHNLRYLKPVSSFRSKYDYDNLFYIVAGEIIARVSGEDYEDYISKHFFEPLEMHRTTMDLGEIENDEDRIDGHAPVDGKLEITPRTFTEIGHPAAGAYSSIDDMSKWVQVRIDYGKYGNNKQDSLFSKTQAEEMWKAQTITPTSKGDYNTNFSAYGLGWVLKDVGGYFEASHTGGLFGIVSQVTIIPELELGIIVLTNQESGAAFTAVTNAIKDGYLEVSGEDRIKQYNDRRLKAEKKANSVKTAVNMDIQKQLKGKAPQMIKDEQIEGVYKDDWYGKVTIEKKEKKELRFTSEKSPELNGTMQPYKGTSYVVRWDDQSLNADAFVNFELNTEGAPKGFTMEAVSPLTDFSFDFQDLTFKRLD